MRGKSLHCLLMHRSELFLVLMVLLFLVTVPLFFVLFKRIHLRMQRRHSTLLASLSSGHHFMVELGIHGVGLLLTLFATAGHSFWKKGRDVGPCNVRRFCFLINATLIPFRCSLSCTRDVEILFFEFVIVGNELLFGDWSSSLESARGLTCRWQLGVLARLALADRVRII
jgi:hypothetical protein